MTEEMYHDILLKEYVEATTLCRSYEQLTTTMPTLFAPFATALAGLVLTAGFGPSANLVLSVAGLGIALFLLNNVYRLRAYYSCYLKRIKDIERLVRRDEEPVMSLYTSGESVAGDSKTISYKLAIALVFWLFILFFAAFAIVSGYALYCGR